MAGLKTNAELCDAIIEDVNAAMRALVTGNYVNFCAQQVLIVQKLANLKKGITDDMQNRNATIETLKEQLRNAGVNVVDIPVKNPIKDGGENGGCGT